MAFEALTAYLDSLGQTYGVPGLDCKIMKEHQPVYRHMAGYSDYIGQRPVVGNELYDVYSCTKVVTMTAVMQLVEQGKISLDDPLSKYLPEFAHMRVADHYDLKGGVWPSQDAPTHPAENPILIHQLMSMTSGLSYNTESQPLQALAERNPFVSTREMVGEMAKMPLLFEPGSRWTYALSHDVLAAVVEVASGQLFGDYLRAHIFSPLAMDDAYMQFPTHLRHRQIAQFREDPDTLEKLPAGVRNSYRFTPMYESGGAGLTCSLDSYILLLDALSCGGVGASGKQILSQSAIDQMDKNWLSETQQADFFDLFGRPGYGYGLGVRVLVDGSAAKSPVGEFGWDGAAGAFGLIDPIHHISLFYTQQILNMPRVYHEIHPRIRDLAYEGLKDQGLV